MKGFLVVPLAMPLTTRLTERDGLADEYKRKGETIHTEVDIRYVRLNEISTLNNQIHHTHNSPPVQS